MASLKTDVDSSPTKKAKLMTSKFIGPAQEEFDSLRDLAIFSLDTYLPNWRNYSLPESYIIPPVFDYMNPDVSDEASEVAQQEQMRKDPKVQLPVTKHRLSEE